MKDITHPAHYTDSPIECIDAIRSMLGAVEFHSYCLGNAMKYLWRCRYKGKHIEDLHKAIFYIHMALGDDPRGD